AAATAVLHVVEQQCLVAGLAVEVEHEQPFGLGIGLAAALGAGGVDDAAGRVAQFRRGRTAVGADLRQRRAAEVEVLRVLGIAARGRDDFVGGRFGGGRGITGTGDVVRAGRGGLGGGRVRRGRWLCRLAACREGKDKGRSEGGVVHRHPSSGGAGAPVAAGY